jgi:hypothetical protein
LEEERRAKIAKGENLPEEDDDATVAQMIQKVFRAFLSRIYVNEIRLKELEFLGMAPVTNKTYNPVEAREDIQKERRLRRVEYLNEYDNALVELKDVVFENEGPEIREKMLDERQQWVVDYMERFEGKPPADVEDFYKREEVDNLLSSEDAAKKKIEEEEKKKAEKEEKKKKKKKDKEKGGKKKKKKGKKKKKKTDDDAADGTKWIEISQ